MSNFKLLAAATAETGHSVFAKAANERENYGERIAVVKNSANTAVFAYAKNEKNYE